MWHPGTVASDDSILVRIDCPQAGGMFGVMLGMFIGKLLGSLISVPAVFSPYAILIGVLFSVVTGTIFGIYPAWKAARMTPVDALRYE